MWDATTTTGDNMLVFMPGLLMIGLFLLGAT